MTNLYHSDRTCGTCGGRLEITRDVVCETCVPDTPESREVWQEYCDQVCRQTGERRYDPVRRVYRDCRFCNGRGCVACEGEAERAYKLAFPDGPKPVATFETTPEGLRFANVTIGAEAIDKAFGPGGGGVAEILHNCRKAAEEGEP